MKRIIQQTITLILLTITVVVFLCYLSIRNTVRFNTLIIGQNEYDSIINSRIEYNGELLESLSFNKHVLFDVSDTNEFFYSVVKNEKNKYNPKVEGISNINNLKLSFLDRNITDQLIANNEHIKALVYNDDYYKEYEIVVTTLPIMNISYEDNDENNLNIQIKDEDVFGTFYLFDNEKNVSESSNLKMHVRGGSTALYPKKGFKLSLKDEKGKSINKNLLNMRNDDDWLLYADYNDQERIRNVFSSKIWYDCCSTNNEFGIAAGMYYKFVELFMNGKYWGLYALGFPIDEKQLNIKAGEVLYKKYEYYIEEKGYDIDREKNVVGYDIKNNVDYYYAQNLLNNYFNTMNDSDNEENLYNIADIQNQIDFYLYNLFVQNIDGVYDVTSKNLYLALKSDKNGKIRSMYIPWDLDQTFGNIWYDPKPDDYIVNNILTYGIGPDYNGVVFKNNSIGKLMNYDKKKIVDMIKTRYYELRDTYLNEEQLYNVIDSYEKDIYYSGSIIRDRNMWPKATNDNSSNLDTFRKYVLDRINEMDKYINEL